MRRHAFCERQRGISYTHFVRELLGLVINLFICTESKTDLQCTYFVGNLLNPCIGNQQQREQNDDHENNDGERLGKPPCQRAAKHIAEQTSRILQQRHVETLGVGRERRVEYGADGHRIMDHPATIRTLPLLRLVSYMRLNATSAKKTGRMTLIRPNRPEAKAWSIRPNTPCTRNHSEAQNITARITRIKHAISRPYLVKTPITGDGSTASMTLVSPERALPVDPLPPDFVLEDAVRAITVMILPMGCAMTWHFLESHTFSNLSEHAISLIGFRQDRHRQVGCQAGEDRG